MTVHLRSTITEIGPEAADLIAGGVLILFAEGAPPELAEVSVLHRTESLDAALAPRPGARLAIGEVEAVLTGIGPSAWAKLHELGHVVMNFNGAAEPERPGELCVAPVDLAVLTAALRPGAQIVIAP
ncbi:PTS glucitol/sorbitol transporter subunit IIA [Pseudoroseomonas cervicalis]|uniref:PTS glucitol/sorbitol transporter subunit IIA n=1 Tax=Teichococcus cervicalis TaxID=204525 RepID=UPI0027812B68|nr:PTS glucitol/sorbitol transporter subunit IIA [Pseudoroseomonas cervicalis]MDQ1078054.1 PTS system glucitol/sorbitol-specific IIA component [Pseudoroseomonas cervicalis]